MWNKIKIYFKNQIQEIESSLVLRIYGFFLSFIHVVTWVFWRKTVPGSLSDGMNSFCWPFFTNCDIVHGLNETFVSVSLFVYLLISLGTAFLFLAKKVNWAYGASIALFVFKFLIQIADYRFMGNYHYMPQLVTLAFLFLPRKEQLAPLLLVVFYFSAGLLKLNYEWLSGSALWRGLPFTDNEYLFQLSTAAVVLLELLFVFGLLSKSNAVRWPTLAVFILFHIVSWHWVGYFYPLICLSMLTIYPLLWYLKAKIDFKLHPSGYAYIFLILLAQAIPKLTSDDPALYGKDRILSLNMIDARAECMSSIVIHDNNKMIEFIPDKRRFGSRVKCDEIIYLNFARNICHSYKVENEMPRVDLFLAARRKTDFHQRELLNITDFCKKMDHYL